MSIARETVRVHNLGNGAGEDNVTPDVHVAFAYLQSSFLHDRGVTALPYDRAITQTEMANYSAIPNEPQDMSASTDSLLRGRR